MEKQLIMQQLFSICNGKFLRFAHGYNDLTILKVIGLCSIFITMHLHLFIVLTNGWMGGTGGSIAKRRSCYTADVDHQHNFLPLYFQQEVKTWPTTFSDAQLDVFSLIIFEPMHS
ncbi:unnamed protein product [Clavelina lepadiformis]|uniref:Transmembrane protein n=1 Tax=Clavelina lepadiformis TaxID=159417 RepID=A0ABP0F6P2_CLALP